MYVLEHKHDTLEEALTHARVAEMTRSMTLNRTHGDTAQQLSIITDKMSRLEAKLSKITTSTVEGLDNSSTEKLQVSFV